MIAVMSSLLLVAALALDPRLARLAEEADVFARSLDKLIGEETIVQRGVVSQAKFRPRIGNAALTPPKPKYTEKELQSEFGYALFRAEGAEEGGVLHEARQVLRVDGREVAKTEKARTRLTTGLRSADDEVKKQLLEDLRKYGLPEAATDFTLTLLLFRQRALEQYTFRPMYQTMSGADAIQVFRFEQRSGDGMTVFHGKKMLRQKLTGELWLRATDGLPVKIRFESRFQAQGEDSVTDVGEVVYRRSAQGSLLPVSALHQRTMGTLLVAESRFSYGGFKRFGADSEIKFTPVDEPEPASAAPPATPSTKP